MKDTKSNTRDEITPVITVTRQVTDFNHGREATKERKTDMKDTKSITPVITVQVELKKSRGGGLYFWCLSSRKAHSSQRIEYSYNVPISETDPFYRAAMDYLSRQGFNEDFVCVVRSHFDEKPDVKIFSFVK